MGKNFGGMSRGVSITPRDFVTVTGPLELRYTARTPPHMWGNFTPTYVELGIWNSLKKMNCIKSVMGGDRTPDPTATNQLDCTRRVRSL